MTKARALEILRTKYPKAEISDRNERSNGSFIRTLDNGEEFTYHNGKAMIMIRFTPNGKWYSYFAPTYADLLNKLSFKVLYKHNVEEFERQYKKLKNNLRVGGYPADVQLAHMLGKADELFAAVSDSGEIEYYLPYDEERRKIDEDRFEELEDMLTNWYRE